MFLNCSSLDGCGKITVLRDGFYVKAWDGARGHDLSSGSGVDDGGGEAGVRKQYAAVVQDQGPDSQGTPFPFLTTCTEGLKSMPNYHSRHSHRPIIQTPEKAVLGKSHDEIARRTDCEPRGIFWSPVDPSARSTAGLVGPQGASTFPLWAIECALAEMEGGGGDGRRAGGTPSPTGQTQRKAFFKTIKGRGTSPGSTSAVSRGAEAAGKACTLTGPKTSGGGGGAGGGRCRQWDGGRVACKTRHS